MLQLLPSTVRKAFAPRPSRLEVYDTLWMWHLGSLVLRKDLKLYEYQLKGYLLVLTRAPSDVPSCEVGIYI